MKRPKKIGLVASILTATLLLAGCSAGAPSTQATGTLKFYTDKGAWKPQFTALNPTSQKDVKISLNTSGYSDENQYQAFIKQSFRTAESPGLFTWATGSALQQLVSQKLVANTSSIWKQAIASGEVSPSLEKDYTVDGQQYCVPLNIAYWVMYYNKKVFAQNHVTVPTTWSGLMSDAANSRRTASPRSTRPLSSSPSRGSRHWSLELIRRCTTDSQPARSSTPTRASSRS